MSSLFQYGIIVSKLLAELDKLPSAEHPTDRQTLEAQPSLPEANHGSIHQVSDPIPLPQKRWGSTLGTGSSVPADPSLSHPFLQRPPLPGCVLAHHRTSALTTWYNWTRGTAWADSSPVQQLRNNATCNREVRCAAKPLQEQASKMPQKEAGEPALPQTPHISNQATSGIHQLTRTRATYLEWLTLTSLSSV